jgi:hypothetical protein
MIWNSEIIKYLKFVFLKYLKFSSFEVCKILEFFKY